MDKRIKRHLRPQDVVVLSTIQHLSPSQIAPIAGVSRQAVWKILQNEGVNTSKGPGGATRVKYECDFCGKPFEMTRARWRNSMKHFCSTTCYFASLENPRYHPWRQGQRLARAIISQYFEIPEGAVIHYKDGDERNNNLSNLAVYASQGDHMANHRNNHKSQPLWDGASL